ncbi:MAG: histidine kinase [Pyrinomonadaceae bacterium]
MEKTTRNRGIRQVLLVIMLAALAVVFLNSLSYGFSRETFFDSVFHSLVIGSTVCFGVLWIIPRVEEHSLLRRLVFVSAAILITGLIGVFITRFFLGLYYAQEFGNYYMPSRRTFIFSLVISYTFGFSAYFYISSQARLEQTERQLKQKELDEANARSLAAEAQLAALESKIHPHFLFNTLNSIAALIRENPDLAEKMVEKLSALLRYSLDFKPQKLVSFSEELKITKDYLEIESARFADKLVYDFRIEPDLHERKIPAFALQTLVENSIKHVAAISSKTTEIEVRAWSSEHRLCIEVKDNGRGFAENAIKTGTDSIHSTSVSKVSLTAKR